MDDGDADIDPAEEPILHAFLEQLEQVAEQAGYGAGALDAQRARQVLEICAGDLDMAVGLYWDDFLANQARQQREDEEQNEEEDEAQPQQPPPPEEGVAGEDVPAVLLDEPEGEGRVQIDGMNLILSGEAEDDSDEELKPLEKKRADRKKRRRKHRSPSAQRPSNDEDNIARMIAQAQAALRRLDDGEAVVNNRENQEIAQSVSDDEGRSWRVVDGKAIKTGNDPEAPTSKRRKIGKGRVADDSFKHDGDSGYLSENDWILETEKPVDYIFNQGSGKGAGKIRTCIPSAKKARYF